jgi:D-alanyl-D-alanine carboxypeptidase
MVIPASPITAQRGNPSVQFEGQSIDQMIADFMAERHIPGVTLAIVQAPYISRVTGYGVTDLETRRLASPHTLWDIGQMTRAYTAVAIMQLVEAGKVNLDDAIGKHVKELPAAWQAVTVRQLMAHASGLPDYTKQPGFDPAREYTAGEIVALVRNMPSAFKPGAQAAASATDFFLLALAIEHASGMSYEAFVTKHQIERLDLKHTVFVSGLASVKQEALDAAPFKHSRFLQDRPYIDPTEAASGYTLSDGAPVKARRSSGTAWNGSGAIYASAADISLWDIGLAGGLLVTEKKNRDILYAAATIDGGAAVPANAGWRFPKHKGLMDIEGNVPGFSCYLARFTDPGELLCVTLCGNRDGIDFTDLGRRIAGAFNPKLGPPAAVKGMISRESTYSVPETVDRLESFLKAKGVEVSARIDHSAAAKKEGLELPRTQVLIFGNPAVGTRLMQQRRSIALDLPLRVVVWEEADGTVWAGYDEVGALAARHGITDSDAVITSMRTALEAAVKHATAPY